MRIPTLKIDLADPDLAPEIERLMDAQHQQALRQRQETAFVRGERRQQRKAKREGAPRRSEARPW